MSEKKQDAPNSNDRIIFTGPKTVYEATLIDKLRHKAECEHRAQVEADGALFIEERRKELQAQALEQKRQMETYRKAQMRQAWLDEGNDPAGFDSAYRKMKDQEAANELAAIEAKRRARFPGRRL